MELNLRLLAYVNCACDHFIIVIFISGEFLFEVAEVRRDDSLLTTALKAIDTAKLP